MKVIAIAAILAVMGTAVAQNQNTEENVAARVPVTSPGPKYCSYYADQYDVVKLWGVDKKCYDIFDSGKWAKLGYVCISIVTYNGKTCIAFKFYAAQGYKFTGLWAGASANCNIPTKHPYYVKNSPYYPGKVIYVCLDTFYAFGPTGCCNTDICLYFKATAKKYICKHRCYYGHKTYWGFPSYQICPKKSFYSECSAPLKCYNDDLPEIR